MVTLDEMKRRCDALDVLQREYLIRTYHMKVEAPNVYWPLLVKIVKRAKDEQLAEIGAGILENLLSYHGLQFIDRVEEQARRDRRFRFALKGTWGHYRMKPAVYKRKNKACEDIPPY